MDARWAAFQPVANVSGVEVTVVLGVNVYDAVIYPQVHVQIQTQQFLRQMSVTRVGSDADDDLEREVDQIMNDIFGGYQSATETESDSDSSLQMDAS